MGNCKAATIAHIGAPIDRVVRPHGRVATTITCVAETIGCNTPMVGGGGRDADSKSLWDSGLGKLITGRHRAFDGSARWLEGKAQTIDPSAATAPPNAAVITGSAATTDDNAATSTQQFRAVAFNAAHVDFATRRDDENSILEIVTARSGTLDAFNACRPRDRREARRTSAYHHRRAVPAHGPAEGKAGLYEPDSE